MDAEAVRPPWGEVGRVATLAVIAAASKFYLNVLNTTTIVGGERFQRAALEREPGQGLLTVCNHTRCVEGSIARCGTASTAVQRLLPEEMQLESCV